MMDKYLCLHLQQELQLVAQLPVFIAAPLPEITIPQIN